MKRQWHQTRKSHKTEDRVHCATRDCTCTRLKTEYTVQPETGPTQEWRSSTLCNQWQYSHKTEDWVHCATSDSTCTRLKTEYTVQPVTVHVHAQEWRPSTLCNQWQYSHKTEDRVQCATCDSTHTYWKQSTATRDGTRKKLKIEYTVQPETVLTQEWRLSTLCNQWRYSHKFENRVHYATRKCTRIRLKTEYHMQPETVPTQD